MPKKFTVRKRKVKCKPLFRGGGSRILWKLIITRNWDSQTVDETFIDIDGIEDVKRIVKELNKIIEKEEGRTNEAYI